MSCTFSTIVVNVDDSNVCIKCVHLNYRVQSAMSAAHWAKIYTDEQTNKANKKYGIEIWGRQWMIVKLHAVVGATFEWVFGLNSFRIFYLSVFFLHALHLFDRAIMPELLRWVVSTSWKYNCLPSLKNLKTISLSRDGTQLSDRNLLFSILVKASGNKFSISDTA